MSPPTAGGNRLFPVQTCASASTIGVREARRDGNQEAATIVTTIATKPAAYASG